MATIQVKDLTRNLPNTNLVLLIHIPDGLFFLYSENTRESINQRLMKRSLLHKADENSHFIWQHSKTAWAEGVSKCL